MSFAEILTAQLAEPFRIALLIGLVITQRRTQAATGFWVPLAAGIVFVAVILTSVLGSPQGAAGSVPMAMSLGAGVVANVLLLVPILGLMALWDRRSGGDGKV